MLLSITIFGLTLSVLQVVLIIIGVIESIARAVPSVGMWAPLGIILKILYLISEKLNVKK